MPSLTISSSLLFLFSLTNTLTAAFPQTTPVSEPFTLAANVTAHDLTPSIQSWELTAPTSNGPVAFSGPGTGDLWYQTTDGTTVLAPASAAAEGVCENGGLEVTPGGTSTVPSINTVDLGCDGAATAGVSVVSVDDEDGTLVLDYQGGGWMACPSSVLQREGDDVLLSFKQRGQRTLEGCADVVLLAKY